MLSLQCVSLQLQTYVLFIVPPQPRIFKHRGWIVQKNYTNRFKQVGLNITYYRKLRDLKQEELAEVVGVSRTHLSNIEAPNVPTSVSLKLLFAIADALDIDPSKLLEFR